MFCICDDLHIYIASESANGIILHSLQFVRANHIRNIFVSNNNFYQLFVFCVLFAMPKCCLLEVVVTRGRWLRFDNGVQVSLGNGRDLTQDAELPLGFFLCAFSLVPSLHSRLPALSVFMAFFWRIMILFGCEERRIFSPCRDWDEELRYCSHICPDDVRGVDVSFHSISHTREEWETSLIDGYTHFPSTRISLPWHTVQIYITVCNETHWLRVWSPPKCLGITKWQTAWQPVWSSCSLISLTGSS